MLKDDDDSLTNADDKDVLPRPNDVDADGCADSVNGGKREYSIVHPLHEDYCSFPTHAEGLAVPPIPQNDIDPFPLMRDTNDSTMLHPEFHFPIDLGTSRNPHVRNDERITSGVEQFHPPRRETAADYSTLNRPIEFHSEAAAHPPDWSASFRPETTSGWQIVVQPQDVILGRGKGSDHHWGNKTFKGKPKTRLPIHTCRE